MTSAREFEDADLLLCATCELGAALLAVGDVEEGVSLMDQAMAAALAGEGGDLDTVVLVSCRTITACSRAADIKRAVQWIRAADELPADASAPPISIRRVVPIMVPFSSPPGIGSGLRRS